MPPKESESLAFLKVGEAVSQGLYYSSKSIYPLEEVEEDPVWAEEWAKENPYLKMDMETVRAIAKTTLSIVGHLMPRLIGIYPFIQRPDNKRLVHLARSKKKRVRKKNLHRLFKKYQAEQMKGE